MLSDNSLVAKQGSSRNTCNVSSVITAIASMPVTKPGGATLTTCIGHEPGMSLVNSKDLIPSSIDKDKTSLFLAL